MKLSFERQLWATAGSAVIVESEESTVKTATRNTALFMTGSLKIPSIELGNISVFKLFVLKFHFWLYGILVRD